MMAARYTERRKKEKVARIKLRLLGYTVTDGHPLWMKDKLPSVNGALIGLNGVHNWHRNCREALYYYGE